MLLGFEEKSGLEVQTWECRTPDDATQRVNIEEIEVQGQAPRKVQNLEIREWMNK